MKKKITQDYLGRIRRVIIVTGETDEEIEEAYNNGDYEEVSQEVMSIDHLEDEWAWEDLAAEETA